VGIQEGGGEACGFGGVQGRIPGGLTRTLNPGSMFSSISSCPNGVGYPSEYEHSNDIVFFRAVEPDSLIAVLWHCLAFLSFGFL